MNRFQAFAVHLAISAAVLAVILYFVFFWWYPDFFFSSDGGGQGLKIVLLVDLVLGPVLTLVVFNPTKPELKRDLTIIGVLQAVCLAAGTFIVWSERPVALVYVDGIFYSVPQGEFSPEPDLSPLPGGYPKQVYVEIPEDLFEQNKLRSEAWRSGRPLRLASERYRPWPELADKYAESFPMEVLQAKDETGALNAWADEHGPLSEFAFFPFGARYGFSFLGVDRQTGEIVDMLDVPAVEAEAEAD